MQISKIFLYTFILLIFLKLTYATDSVNKIDNIEVESSSDITKITVYLNKVKFDYKIDRFPSPNRLVINFKNTELGDLEKNIDLRHGSINNIKLKESSDKNVEVIIEVSEFAPYYVIEEQGSISLQFENISHTAIPKKELKIAQKPQAEAPKPAETPKPADKPSEPVAKDVKPDLYSQAIVSASTPKVEPKQDVKPKTEEITPKKEEKQVTPVNIAKPADKPSEPVAKDVKPDLYSQAIVSASTPKVEPKQDVKPKTEEITTKKEEKQVTPVNIAKPADKPIEPVAKKETEKKEVLPEILDVKIEEQNEYSTITIHSSEPVDYKMLELPAKHYLVLDIPYADFKLKEKVQEINGPVVLRIRSSVYQKEPFKIIRIVVEMKENRPYFINKKDKVITLMIDKDTPMPVTVKDEPVAVKPKTQEKKDIPKPAQTTAIREKSVEPQKQEKVKKVEEKAVSYDGAGADEQDTQKLISLDFRDAQIGNVLRMLSAATNMNIVAGSDVKGTITIRVDKVPWETALTNILAVNGFGYQKKGNIVYVAKRELIKLEEEKLGKEQNPQIIIEAMLVDVNIAKISQLGIQWILEKNTAPGSQGNDSGLLAVGTFSTTQDFRNIINQQIQNKDMSILSILKVATLNNEEAKILMENQIPLQLIDNNNNKITKLIPVGIKLMLKPHLTSQDNMVMKINPEVSGIKKSMIEGVNIEVATNAIETNILLKNNQTAVIGGLLRREENKTDSGVPVYKRTPLFGSLFNNKQEEQTEQRKEIMIFITPYINR